MSPNPWMGVRLPVPGSPEPTKTPRETEQFYLAKVRQEYSEAVAQANQYAPAQLWNGMASPPAMAAVLSAARQHFQSYEPTAADLACKGCPELANLLRQIESDIQTALGIQQQSAEATQKAQQDAQKILSDAAAQAAKDIADTVKQSNERAMDAIGGLFNRW